jgi:hypothetical protein
MSDSPQLNNANHRENYTSNQKTFIDALSTQTQTLSEIVNSYETKIYKDLTLSEDIISKINDHIVINNYIFYCKFNIYEL